MWASVSFFPLLIRLPSNFQQNDALFLSLHSKIKITVEACNDANISFFFLYDLCCPSNLKFNVLFFGFHDSTHWSSIHVSTENGYNITSVAMVSQRRSMEGHLCKYCLRYFLQAIKIHFNTNLKMRLTTKNFDVSHSFNSFLLNHTSIYRVAYVGAAADACKKCKYAHISN